LQERLSFEALYESQFVSTWAMLKYLGVPPSQLDDAAQELWVVVHRRYAEFEGRSGIRTWLFAIAVNVERNFRRAERRRGPIVALPSGLREPYGDPGLDQEAREAWDLVLGFVQTLDETRRTVFVASLLEGLSAAETAEVTGLDQPTVYNRVRALRRSFQLWIEQHRSEP
jgi:RNA polymerase sigma-70 factor (ECF subfamily)